MEYQNLLTLIKECPEITIQIKLKDLIQANEMLMRQTIMELKQVELDTSNETYLSRKEVSEMLGVDKSTLWRWNKKGYLFHIEIGGKRAYRMSDIQQMLDEGEQKSIQSQKK